MSRAESASSARLKGCVNDSTAQNRKVFPEDRKHPESKRRPKAAGRNGEKTTRPDDIT